jgi:choline dehydrogenase-like flavoprotein
MTSLTLLGDSPHRGVQVFADYAGPISERCTVLVVGSGPGGAVVAKELAELDVDVILLEEGPPFGAKDFRQEAGASMRRTLREQGMRIAFGKRGVMPTMQANALGGGSLINSAICARAPAFTLERWRERTGIGLTRRLLDPHYARVEAFLGVEPTPQEVLGARNLRFKAGCDSLGMSSEPTHRNVRGCKGSGECFTGCRNGAKKSVDVSYVPAAIRAGARVLTSVRAERLIREGDRVRGIRGRVMEPFTGRATHEVEIRADAVVLAAGCMQTPVILMKSGLGGRWVGEELQFHPGLAVMAMYEDAIDPWVGATQGYHSLHHIEEGIKLEVLWAPPAILATRLPGVGHEYQKNLLGYDRMAPFDVITAAERSRGRVRASRLGWEPRIAFDLHEEDMALLQRGLAILSDICWASGAVGVLPGIHGIPDVLTSREEAEVLRTRRIDARDAVVGSNHAFGTTRMSARSEDGVVDEWGKHHQVPNLYVADTGVFVGSPGVNPMLTVMAIADRIALGIARDL